MSKQTQLLQNSLPLIAAGLGDKLGVRVTVSGNQAYTDGQSINIPDFQISSKEEKDAVLGLMSHEAAHIKFHSFRGISDDDIRVPLRKHMWNILEDCRIETAMIDSMIGTKKWMNQIWINRQKEGTRETVTKDDAPASILCDYLLFTCRVHYRGQQHLESYLDAAEEAFIEVFGWKLLSQLEALLTPHIGRLSSSEQAMALAKQVEDLIKHHEPEEEDKSSQEDPDNSSEPQQSEESSDEQSDETNTEEQPDAESSPETQENEQSQQGESEDDSSEQDATESSAESEDATESYEPSKSQVQPEHVEPSPEEIAKAIVSACSASEDDFTDEMEDFAMQLTKLAKANATQSTVCIPEHESVVATSYMQGQGDGLLKSVKQTSNMLTAKLQGLVQENMRATAKTSISGRKLNSKVLQRYSVGDGRLFKTKTTKKQIDTIVEIAIDNSGSMVLGGVDLLIVAKEAQVALAYALNRIHGVSVTASAFPLTHYDNTVMELLSEGENVKQLPARLSHAIGQGCHTPSASAMWHCLRKVLGSQKEKKVILFITDGYPNCNQQEELCRLVKKGKQSDVLIIGIAIGDIADNKPDFYQFFDNALFISDIRDLKKELFKVAQDILLD